MLTAYVATVGESVVVVEGEYRGVAGTLIGWLGDNAIISDGSNITTVPEWAIRTRSDTYARARSDRNRSSAVRRR